MILRRGVALAITVLLAWALAVCIGLGWCVAHFGMRAVPLALAASGALFIAGAAVALRFGIALIYDAFKGVPDA